MANTMRLTRLVSGCAAAGLVVFVATSAESVRAAPRARRAAGGLQIQNISVARATNVPADRIIETTFNQAVDPSSVGPATFQIRSLNAAQTGFAKQIYGTFQVVGNLVRFFPRLPTHLRDPNTGDFFPIASVQDDAARNASSVVAAA